MLELLQVFLAEINSSYVETCVASAWHWETQAEQILQEI